MSLTSTDVIKTFLGAKPDDEKQKYVFIVNELKLFEQIYKADYYAVLIQNEAELDEFKQIVTTALTTGGYVRERTFLFIQIKKDLAESLKAELQADGVSFDRQAYLMFKDRNTAYLTDDEVKNAIDQYIKSNAMNASGSKIISAADLQEKEIAPISWIVDNMLTSGETLLTAASKIGKSWLALDLAINVAQGYQFLGRKTEKGGVLYLALEDSERRIKNRMEKLLKGAKAPKNLYFLTKAKTLDMGLIDELDDQIKDHRDIKVIIIDTFQKIRSLNGGKNAYAADYEDMGKIKDFADSKDLAVLLIHHNRKMKDDSDVFNMISGTNGIMGAADTIIVLTKEKRTDTQAKMHITGRDVMGDVLIMEFNKETCKWKCLGDEEAIEVFKENEEYNNDPIVITIRELMRQNADGWKGTATDMQDAVMKYGREFIEVRAIGRKLRDIKQQLYELDKVIYNAPSNSSNGKRYHVFKKEPVIDILNNNVVNVANDVDVVDVANVANY